MLLFFLEKMTRSTWKTLGMFCISLNGNELRLKFGKCIYMTHNIVYLGLKSNKNHVTPVKEKFENIKTAKEPRNVSELTLLWRRSLSYKNYSTDLHCKSIDWFL